MLRNLRSFRACSCSRLFLSTSPTTRVVSELKRAKRHSFRASNGLQETTGETITSPPVLPDSGKGIVLSSQANYYRVRIDDSNPELQTVQGVELLCKKRSLLRKKGMYVLVGDRVEVVSIDWLDGRALVSTVFPRTVETSSPRVANVDHYALVFAITEPAFEEYQATRFLVAAESSGIKCSLLLNKCDLVSEVVVQQTVEKVAAWGYQAIPLSVHSGLGLDEVERAMQGRMSVLAGPSGVGKSSIINVLRFKAMDTQQQARLAKFQQKMAEEFDGDWRDYADDGGLEGVAEPIGAEAAARGGEMNGGGGEAGATADGAAVATSANGAGDVGSAGEQVVGNARDGNGAAARAEELAKGKKHWKGPLPEVETAAWRKKTGDVYGAQAVGNVGFKSRRGRHTTRSAVLLDLPSGGLLVDTPGFNYPYMEKVTVANIASLFPEIVAIAAETPCRFNNCTHVHEPGCVVREAGLSRYEFYTRLRAEVVEREEVENTKLQMQKRRRQGHTKNYKVAGGRSLEVARLDHNARRVNRTTSKLDVIQQLDEDEDEDDE